MFNAQHQTKTSKYRSSSSSLLNRAQQLPKKIILVSDRWTGDEKSCEMEEDERKTALTRLRASPVSRSCRREFVRHSLRLNVRAAYSGAEEIAKWRCDLMTTQKRSVTWLMSWMVVLDRKLWKRRSTVKRNHMISLLVFSSSSLFSSFIRVHTVFVDVEWVAILREKVSNPMSFFEFCSLVSVRYWVPLIERE